MSDAMLAETENLEQSVAYSQKFCFNLQFTKNFSLNIQTCIPIYKIPPFVL
jgi:hypothetical protein